MFYELHMGSLQNALIIQERIYILYSRTGCLVNI